MSSYLLQMWTIVHKEVEAYQSDVLHDAQRIERDGEDKQYIWILRPTGTALFTLPIAEEGYLKMIVAEVSQPDRKVYLITPAQNEVKDITDTVHEILSFFFPKFIEKQRRW